MCGMKAKRDDPVHIFGKKLRELRLKAGLSQEALADLAGVHRNYLGETERGLRNVSLRNIVKIAAALKVHPGKLFP
jgi:transcriptional regulator with XRE-family HTH domain